VTESEWLECDDPRTLLQRLGRPAAYRLSLLQSAAYHRSVWDDLPHVARRGIELMEQLADRTVVKSELTEVMESLKTFVGRAPTSPDELVVFRTAAAVYSSLGQPDRIFYTWDTDQPRRSAAGIRDIFGNPFRSVTFPAAWRSDTAVALAKHMCDSRDFSAMPILADALQEAGCEQEDILSHCSDAGATHVRGCWVIDLVLGKE
jgi:hypothetical protein